MDTSQPPVSLREYLTEENVTQECKELISTLPVANGWIGNSLHDYQGFWYTARQLSGVLNCQKHFHARDHDIVIVTMPKSGTTWLKALCFSLMNREKYPDFQNHPLLSSNPHFLLPNLEVRMTDGNGIHCLANMHSPRLLFTHMPVSLLRKNFEDSSCKIVYLCRNPKDNFVSLWHFTNKLRPEGTCLSSMQEAFDKFCRGVSPYGPFWDHVSGYWGERLENPERVLFLRFEEMKEQPAIQLKKLADFLGFPFSAEEENKGVVEEILKLCSFDTLSNLEVTKTGKLPSGVEFSTFFRKGEVGDWGNHLSEEMGETLDQITKEKFCGSGFKF